MAIRRSARTMVRAPKRSMFWEGTTFAVTSGTGTVSAGAVVSESVLENIPNPTLVRVRGEFVAYATAIGASGAQAIVGIGLIRVTGRALAAGVSSLPTPITDQGSDWLYHKMFPISVRGSLGADSEATGAHVFRWEIDNKSMRKFELNQAIALVTENSAITSTVTVQITGALRFLFKK